MDTEKLAYADLNWAQRASIHKAVLDLIDARLTLEEFLTAVDGIIRFGVLEATVHRAVAEDQVDV